METKHTSSSENSDRNALSAIEQPELFDICVHKGILQEVNRTFFNPLGLVLQLNEDSQLVLKKSIREEGPVINMINRLQRAAFINYSETKRSIRQKFYGFVIQVHDMLRSETIEQPLSTIKQRRLNILLSALDRMVYDCKRAVMEKNSSRDDSIEPLSESNLIIKMHKHHQKENWISMVNYICFIKYRELINAELAKIVEVTKPDA